MSEERLEHSIALLLARWMGGENLREATEEVQKLKRHKAKINGMLLELNIKTVFDLPPQVEEVLKKENLI